jgi:hypothetical protein
MAVTALCARLDWLVVVEGTRITHLHDRVLRKPQPNRLDREPNHRDRPRRSVQFDRTSSTTVIVMPITDPCATSRF